MCCLLSKVLLDLDCVELICQWVYMYNVCFVECFCIDCVLLVGDVVYIMLVWQGQGYNSGMCDVFNLVWKLVLVVNGKVGEMLFDSYQQECCDYVKVMIDLLVIVGYVLVLLKCWQGVVCDGFFWLLNYLLLVKCYFFEMCFKLMLQYCEGVLLMDCVGKILLVGKMFI